MDNSKQAVAKLMDPSIPVRIPLLLGVLMVNAVLIAQGGRPSSAVPYQEPHRPFPYIEEDVLFESTYRGSRIAGTLTLPRSASKVPAVILIGGSGPQDRDGGPGGSGVNEFRHKPQLVLADHLTRSGLAVLRVDQRGVGGSTASAKPARWEDLADDVLAEIRYLSNRTEIDPKLIGLIGRSGGGDIAAMAATKSRDIAFIVLMAAPGLPGDESRQLQGAALLRAYDQSDAVIAMNRAQHQQIYEMVKARMSATRIQKQIDAFAAQQVASGLSQELRNFNGDKEYYSPGGVTFDRNNFCGGIYQARVDLFFAGKRQTALCRYCGDWGTGGGDEVGIAQQMFSSHQRSSLDFVISAGDNIYPNGSGRYFSKHFEHPFANLLKDRIKFYTVLGNHDVEEGRQDQCQYPLFNMGALRITKSNAATAWRSSLCSTRTTSIERKQAGSKIRFAIRKPHGR
jgi:pimeloyl-ACP methyl ester carboxylesterase